mmetsp:Transcript_59552/g.176856  ORF Transcript_59552/g.176856 Transcript_59552/m.176856 type:complete len:212 (-) Transcript_59552:960-1595(-)
MAVKLTARPSARAEQRPMSEKNGCAFALECSTPNSTTSQASSCSSSSATAAMPVTKPRPVSRTVQPSLSPSCSASRMSAIASESRSRCTAERRDWPNSATALCEQPWSISHARAYASRGVVAGKVSCPVSARMPSAKSVASVSLSTTRRGGFAWDRPASAASSAHSSAVFVVCPASYSARSCSTSTVVAEPTRSWRTSSGEISPQLPPFAW